MAKTLEEHYGYLSDRAKLAQYQAAIERLVRPEHVVMDLGCGTGLLGLMALRAGAQKVLFVDQNGAPHVLEYNMMQTENGWLIDGVEYMAAPPVGV